MQLAQIGWKHFQTFDQGLLDITSSNFQAVYFFIQTMKPWPGLWSLGLTSQGSAWVYI